MFKRALLFILLTSPGAAQQVTCPTRPAADNSHACANTIWVNGAITTASAGYVAISALGTGTYFALQQPLNGTGGLVGYGGAMGNVTGHASLDLPLTGGGITGISTYQISGDWYTGLVGDASLVRFGGFNNNTGVINALISALNTNDFNHYYISHNVAQSTVGAITTTDDNTNPSYVMGWTDAGFLYAFEAPAVGGSGPPVFASTPTFQLNMITGALKLNGNAVLYSGGALGAPSSGTIPTAFIPGNVSGSNASAGYLGEIISSSVAVGSAVSQPSSGTAINVTSVTLTAGDWDCEGSVITNPAGTTTTSRYFGGMSTTSITLPTAPGGGYATTGAAQAAGVPESLALVRTQFQSSSSQTIYLVANATFATSTMSHYGQISCRRVR